MCVNKLSRVALGSAAAEIQPRYAQYSNRKSGSQTTRPPSHRALLLQVLAGCTTSIWRNRSKIKPRPISKNIMQTDTDTRRDRNNMFFMFYLHDSIVFIINCCITLLQHVRGQSALCCQINVCMYVCTAEVVRFNSRE